jgi:hypothetical protein
MRHSASCAEIAPSSRRSIGKAGLLASGKCSGKGLRKGSILFGMMPDKRLRGNTKFFINQRLANT